MNKDLSRSELEGLHSVLRRAAERAERNRDTCLATKLAQEIAELDADLAGFQCVTAFNDNRKQP